MKTMIKNPIATSVKTLLAVAFLSVLSFPAVAQENQPELHAGDTVAIDRAHKKYLTGETMSTWVYDYRHVIRQVGGIRFPQGVLLRGINSWVKPEALHVVGPHQETVAAPAEEQVQQEKEQSAEQKKQATAQSTVQRDSVAEQAADLPIFLEKETAEAEKAAQQAKAEKKENSKEDIAEAVADSAAKVISQEAAEKVAEQLPLTAEDTLSGDEAKKARSARMHRFSIGVRGGVASLMHETDAMGNWRAGFDGLLDLQYAYYGGIKEGKHVNCGFITGVSVGWSQSGLRSGVDTAYTVSTSDGTIDYTVSADQVDEQDGQLQLEVPLMFSLLTDKGFFFNIGPKFVLPVYRHYNQGITTPDINAYFQEEGVNVSNEVITGLVTDDQLKTKGKWSGSKLNVMVTAELGYEWALRNGGALGLGVYANYSVYDLYKNDTSNKSLIHVTAPSSASPATVDVLSATDTYTKGLGYFDCGLKLIYHFQFPKK